MGELPSSYLVNDPAPLGRRLGAWAVDAGLLLVAAILLGVMTWGRLQDYVAGAGLPAKALKAGSGLLTSGGDVEKIAADFGVDVWDKFVGYVVQAIVLLVLIELVYHFVATLWKGRTLGKVALDVRVCRFADGARTPGPAAAFRRALAATLAGTGVYAVAWIFLLQGWFFLSVVAWAAAVAVFTANLLPLPFARTRRTLNDLLSGTVVVRAGTHRQAAEAARQGAQAVRENAGRLAQHDRVQSALRSDQARRAQDLGRQALESERGRQAQDLGRKLGDRVKNRARRQPPSGPPQLPPPSSPQVPPPGSPQPLPASPQLPPLASPQLPPPGSPQPPHGSPQPPPGSPLPPPGSPQPPSGPVQPPPGRPPR
ncbi:RDD family protein [Spirillospora sp. CA-294931]|uniref:RDD family protein n=1 Tax=Spirillospora sp. CA-294931 TaxID=3240042 RepID=UPI003D8A0301